jgi:hypothetical protein
MRLVDRYEEELLEAARRLQDEPARRAGLVRALAGAGRGLAWVPAVVVLAVAVAISAAVMTGGRERDEADAARLVGWYASPVGTGQPLPKGAPHGSTLRLDGDDGRYRLRTDVYRVSGRYRVRGDVLELLSARYEFLPTFRTGMLSLPPAGQCRTALGLYRVIRGRDLVRFRLTHDSCRARARVLSRAAWRWEGP